MVGTVLRVRGARPSLVVTYGFVLAVMAAGYGVLVPQGTYFVVADIRPLGFDDDLAFCRALPATKGVAGRS